MNARIKSLKTQLSELAKQVAALSAQLVALQLVVERKPGRPKIEK